MEIKWYTPVQPMYQRRNQKGNKNILTEMKIRHNKPKPIGCSKNSSNKNVYNHTHQGKNLK